MTVAELEHATMSPSRFLTYLRRGLTGGNSLQQTLSVMTLDSGIGSSYRGMALVPGGEPVSFPNPSSLLKTLQEDICLLYLTALLSNYGIWS